jgi:hypothetical protein
VASIPEIDLDAYRRIVRKLPRPTDEQIADFVDFVSNAHSWYKKLPLVTEGVPFCFYIDPFAGFDYSPSGRNRFKAIRREEEGFHYSWLATDDYVQRFGSLQYSSSYRSQIGVLGIGDNHVFQGISRPMFIGDDGRWLAVPIEIVNAGTAMVTGVMHVYSSELWCLLNEIAFQEEDSTLVWPEASGGGEALERIKQLFDEWMSLTHRRAKLKTDIERDYIYEKQQSLNADLDEIFAPERKRLRREMKGTVNRMLDLAYD